MKANELMKKLTVFVLIVCLLLCGIPATVYATEAAEAAEEEEFVIPEDAVYLSTPEDLLDLAENCISDAWSRGKVFVLKNDINLSEVAFEGIPTFGGTFLGQGFTVSGVRLAAQQNAQGFFRYLQKTAVVDGLNLVGMVQPVKDNNLDIGGLIGVNSGTVKNCSFTGTVSGTERIGGIAGRNKVSGIVENCCVYGTVYGDHYIGGIVGDNLGVIRSCVNKAKVNTRVDQNAVSVGITSGLSLDSLTVKESTSDATNIGGIAGTSSGVIRACENHANVGYEKMGYNVGGIAGSQIGYMTECTNHGAINGSDGVGGIVGQFKPNVVIEMGENYLDQMLENMQSLMGSMSGMMNSMSSMMGGVSFNKENMEDAMDMLKDPENLDSDTLKAAMNEFSNSFNNMYNDMMDSGSKMTSQMSGMMGTMGGMVDTIEKLQEGVNLKIIDISKEDTPENTQTKISSCVNYGPVQGENYVGGITGIADIEDTTAQDDVAGELNFATEGEMIMRLVIRDCRNAATVTATKEYAGGIVGNMTIGAVFNGMNTGSVNALNANYVGGIAGSCETYIVDSTSRCILAGDQYVGGIAGFGAEVVGCHAVTEIAAATKFTGGILGYTDPLPDEEMGLILNNRYYLTDKTFGGIDGVCYEGATAPMTIAEFLEIDSLNDCFKTVDIRFAAAGQEDVVLTVELGKSLALAKTPELAVGDHQQYHWQLIPSVTSETLSMGETADVEYISKEKLTNILFDQTYEALFDAKNTVIYSEEKTESGRPIALAVGTFDQSVTLSLSEIADQEPNIDGVSVQEVWKVSLTDIGIEKLHYHIPEDVDAENIILYVKDISGNWVQRSFTTEGSYMIFDFVHGESAFALEVRVENQTPVVAVTAVVLVLLIVVGIVMNRRRKRKGTISGEK